LSLRQRLAKVERVLAERKRKVDLADCRCGKPVITLAGQAKELEAELNGTCPTHGFLRVGTVIHLGAGELPEDPESVKEERRREAAEISQIIGQYNERKRDWMRQQSVRRKLSLEIEDGSSEA
jgi:hypothetical protein